MGARKIAALAEAHNVALAPHKPLSPISLAVCMQAAAVAPNFAFQEYPSGFENLVLESRSVLLGSALVKNHPVPTAGFAALPDAPGISVKRRDDIETLRPQVHKTVSMRRTIDGALLDQ